MNTVARIPILSCSTALLVALGAAAPAGAVPLIVNGGFESGFASWTLADALGSDGTFHLQSGTMTPVSGNTVPAPPGGVTAAMSDAEGPGSHVLYQDFLVPASPGTAILTFDLFIGNRAGDFFTPSPATLDFASPAMNQQARADILLGGTDPFTVSPSDVLMSLFQTNPGNPAITGYSTHSVDLTALLAANVGNTLRLRFAETDNVFTFNFGVDDVSLETQVDVPEPGSWLLFGGGLIGLLAFGRSRMICR